MKIRFLNYRKYGMSRMPWYMYLPRFKRLWNNQIWHFTVLRDYGIELDFREGNFITWALNDIKKLRWREILKGRQN